MGPIERFNLSNFFAAICYLGFTTLLSINFLLVDSFYHCSLAAECEDLTFEHEASDYYGPDEYFTTCPDDGLRIRCHHYHRHWVCEKGENLFWDRRLESAARTACGCPLPADTAPASPAISGKPKKRIFGSED